MHFKQLNWPGAEIRASFAIVLFFGQLGDPRPLVESSLVHVGHKEGRGCHLSLDVISQPPFYKFLARHPIIQIKCYKTAQMCQKRRQIGSLIEDIMQDPDFWSSWTTCEQLVSEWDVHQCNCALVQRWTMEIAILQRWNCVNMKLCKYEIVQI